MDRVNLLFHEHGLWDEADHPYDAHIYLIFPSEVVILTGSTWPNPYDPNQSSKRLTEAYGCIDTGRYAWRFSETGHNGTPAVNIEENRPVTTLAPNPNQDGQMYATHIDIHEGYSPSWRGSGGCLTVVPDDYPQFLDAMRELQKGTLQITRDANRIA